jgi:hypothetical protein
LSGGQYCRYRTTNADQQGQYTTGIKARDDKMDSSPDNKLIGFFIPA